MDKVKFRVLLLDTKPSDPNHYICLGIERALQNHPDAELVYKACYADAITLARKLQCNFFMAFGGEGLNFEICRRVRDVCGYAVLWATEDPYELHANLRTLDIFNRIFTNDSGSVAAYGGKASHLPLAAIPFIQYLPVREDIACYYDVFFAGTAWPNRVDTIREISTLLSGKIQLKLAMPVNQYLPAIEDFSYPPSSYNWRTSNIQFARFANRSRITLGLHRDFAATPGSPTKALTPGPRIFEVAMAGGFQLIEQSLAEIDEYFIPDHEIVLFGSQKECLEKIEYYLAHSEERIAIAQAAQKRALQDHQYANRLDKIFELVQEDFLTLAQADLKIDTLHRPKILFLSLNTSRDILNENPLGQLKAYQRAISAGLKDAYDLYFLVPRTNDLAQDYDLLNERDELIESLHFDYPYSDNRLVCSEREAMYSSLLTRYHIELLHIEHLKNHSPGITFIAKALGIPVVYSWHDYYGICKNSTLTPALTPGLQSNGHSQQEDDPINYCEECLKGPENIAINSQAVRKEYFYRALNQASAILYPSVDLQKRVHHFFRPFTSEMIQLVLKMPSIEDLEQVNGVEQYAQALAKLYDQLIPSQYQQNINVPFQAFTARECGIYVNNPFWYGGFIAANLPSNSQKSSKMKIRIMRIKEFYLKHGFLNGLKRWLKGHDGYHNNSL
jgi:spore maturation protein CgeB